jgi:dethiobiotin synthetase
MKTFFVTGIGTNVGKTIASAIITEALQADYWKPIQSGTIDGSDKHTVSELISNEKTKVHDEIYAFREPASPHLAASLENQTIQLSKLVLPESSNHLVIEGAGGILVPINSNNFVIDIANSFNCDVILVIRNYLGCINQSLLSIDYLVSNNYNLKGLVLIGNFDKLVKSAILNHAEIPVILEINELEAINKEVISEFSKNVNVSVLLED